MTPAGKLEFLEKLAFKNVDIVKIKDKVKNLKKEREIDWKSTLSQLQSIDRKLERIEKPIEKVKFPFKCKNGSSPKNSDNIQIIINNETIKFKKLKAKLLKSKNVFAKKNKQLTELRVMNTYINTKNENNIEDKLNKNQEKLNDICELYKGDKNLENLKKKLSYLLNEKEFLKIIDTIKDYNIKLKEIH